MKEKNNSKDNDLKSALSAIKKRICIGAIAIFAVTCCGLWNNDNVTHTSAIFLSIYVSMAISILGYFAMKSVVTKHIKEKD